MWENEITIIIPVYNGESTIDNNENYTISSLFKLLSSDEYDFQLVGFRNFADRNDGHIPLMDALLKNTKII